MTRKDYIALADAFARTMPDMGEAGSADRYGYEVWVYVLEEVGKVLEADNPRFDWMRFSHAASEPVTT